MPRPENAITAGDIATALNEVNRVENRDHYRPPAHVLFHIVDRVAGHTDFRGARDPEMALRRRNLPLAEEQVIGIFEILERITTAATRSKGHKRMSKPSRQLRRAKLGPEIVQKTARKFDFVK